MTFNVELFSKLIENKNYTNQDLIDILKNKYRAQSNGIY